MLLTSLSESGLGVKAFADAAGVPHSTLAYWPRRRGKSAEPPRFVAVEVERLRACGGAEVVFGELVVRWGGEVDEGQLERQAGDGAQELGELKRSCPSAATPSESSTRAPTTSTA